MPSVHPSPTDFWKNCFSPLLHRERNAIERMFGRLKNFRRIATRHDRLAINYLTAVCLEATVCHQLWVPTLTFDGPVLRQQVRTKDGRQTQQSCENVDVKVLFSNLSSVD